MKDRESPQSLVALIVESLTVRGYVGRLRELNPAVDVAAVEAALLRLLVVEVNPDLELAERTAEAWSAKQASALDAKGRL